MPKRVVVIDVAELFVDGQVPEGLTITGRIEVSGPFFGGWHRIPDDPKLVGQVVLVAERIEAAIKGAV